MAKLLHTLADFKSLYEFTGTTSDTKLLLLMGQIYTRISAYLGRGLAKTSRTERYQGVTKMVPLIGLPIDTEVSPTVQLISYFSAGEDTYTLSSTEYEIIPEWGIQLATALNKDEKLLVTYTGGFPDGTAEGSNVPLDFSGVENGQQIARAGMIQLIHEWNRRLKPGASEISTDVGTIQMEAMTLLDEVRQTLEPFRHPRFGWFF